MDKRTAGNIILVGFSYTGKTRVGKEVARRLGWTFIDTDDEIVDLAGKPIPEIFAQDGEPKFRKMEKEVLNKVCQKAEQVISTGGGIVVDPSNRDTMSDGGVVICLEAKPTTIHKRLVKDAEENPGEEVRPLLTVPDPLARIEELKASRQQFYSLSDWTIHTDNLSLGEVAGEVIHGWKNLSEVKADISHKKTAACVVTTATESYPIFVGWNSLDQLGQRIKEANLSGKAYVISDDNVFPLYGEQVKKALVRAGFIAESMAIPAGEQSKSFETANRIYDWLVANRVERGDFIVALGGGVIGDLAGFIAATMLRGVPFVQVPTSLMAMVDSSIGGKVGINHPKGKNLIGAFYQPRFVFADVRTLTSLPKREFISGWSEVIKHAMIRDPQLLGLLEKRSQDLLKLKEDITTDVVARSAAIKGRVVSEDEKEQGLRTILNYGHTIAHGLEAATNYDRFLHGEAVSIGMTGASMISNRIGLLSQKVVKRQQALLIKFELPVVYADIKVDDIQQAMQLDKKIKGKKVRWVLLSDVGQTVIRDDVSEEVVSDVIKKLAIS